MITINTVRGRGLEARFVFAVVVVVVAFVLNVSSRPILFASYDY
jgi:hypothetical protein